MAFEQIVCVLLTALIIVLLAYVVFSWIPSPPEPLLPLARGLNRLVTPILEPLRRVIPPLQMGAVALDLSILVVFFVIVILQGAICS